MPKSMTERHLTGEFAGLLLPVCLLMAVGFIVPLLFIFHQSAFIPEFSFSEFTELFESRLFIKVFLTTVEISLATSVLSILLGYPVALHLSRTPSNRRAIYMILVLLPFWTSILVKSYAFLIILGENGIINSILAGTGLPKGEFIFNRIGVLVGMTNFFIPFVVFPILANLLSHDPNLRRAAEVMGASKFRIFWSITFPLSLPGIAAGFVLTFVLSLGFFVTPALLGGRHDMMLANLIDFYTRETLDWPAASAIAVVLLISTALLLALLGRVRGAQPVV